MESSKLAFKFFVADTHGVDPRAFAPVFHGWIQRHEVPDHLLIDVADYQHVHHGPGTMLIAQEGNFGMDNADGKLGLLYVRKQPIDGDFADRIRQVLSATTAAAARLEQDPTFAGRLRFRTDSFLFRVYDRLLGPNTRETFDDVRPTLTEVLNDLFGAKKISLSYNPTEGSPFELLVTAPALPMTDLHSRLSASASNHPASSSRP